MRINAVSSYSTIKQRKLKETSIPTTPVETTPQIPTGKVISFKSGNPRHVFHQISELSLFGLGSGGVGTVGNDLFFNHKDFDRVVENIPLYNQDVTYVHDIKDGVVEGVKQDGVSIRKIPENLPEGNPFKKYAGSPFVTSAEIGKDTNLIDFFNIEKNRKKVFILDELQASTMTWGLEKDVPIGMYKARKTDELLALLRDKGWSEEQIAKTDITFTYVDATASMPKPYADGSYATATGDDLAKRLSVGWQGKPYPKEAKASIELLPCLKEKMGGFDPKFLMCHDGQAMPLIQFAAAKNATKEAYWQDKIVTAIGHNLNDGYMYELGTKDAIVCLASPEEIRKIVDSKEYANALIHGKEDEFLKSLLPKEILDERKNINAVMFPIAYGEKGYVPMFTTVSEGYYKSIIENELISPALFKRLKELSGQNRFKGIINVLMDPNTSGFTLQGLNDGYREDLKLKLADGNEIVIEKFKAFDEAKKYDINHMREVKRHNKLNLLKRFDNKLKGSQLWSATENKWLSAGTGFSQAVAGVIGKKFEIAGGIKPEYIKALEQGKDIPMFVSWGRGDFQKGMDTGLEAFIKFVKKNPKIDAMYVMGGDMKNLKKEVVEVVKDLHKDPLLNGKILLLDGWAPGASIAAAGDYAVLSSRFAPCELTDLEAMKKGCIPITPKVQGMDQKVFDPTDVENAKFINGYKGGHEFYMSEATALNEAKQEYKEVFNKAKNDIVEKLSKDYKSKMGDKIPDDLLQRQLKKSDDYKKALQKLRDSIISDDIANCIERAMNDRNTKIAEDLWRNHVDLKTTFEDNGWLSSTKKSTGELFKELHYEASKVKNISESEVLKLDLSKISDVVSGGGATTGGGTTTTPSKEGNKIIEFFKSKTGKIALGVAAGVAIIGAGYHFFKKSKAPSSNAIAPTATNIPKQAEGQAKNLFAVV